MSALQGKAIVVGGGTLAGLLLLALTSHAKTAVPGEPTETEEEVRDRIAAARNARASARQAAADEMAYQAWLRGQQALRGEP